MVLMQQFTTPPPPPRQMNPDLDEALEQLILDLLRKEPAQRPATTALVGRRLAGLTNEAAPTFDRPSLSGRVDLIPRIPLIGREAALNELVQRWTQIQAGQGQVVLLSGAAGAGKTRLLTEAGLPVRLGNNRSLSGHCRQHGSLPYQPLIEMLDVLLSDLPSSEREGLPIELAHLLPGSSTVLADDKETADPAEAHLRLFAACWEVLQHAAQTSALMITIEDVHWAEPTMLELLEYLARHIEQAPILLILSYRPEEVELDTPLATLQRDLRRSQMVHTISLDPLTRDQVADFLRVALQQSPIPTWLVDSFYRATGGNPLFIEETLKALAAEGRLGEWVAQDLNQVPWASLAGGAALQLPQSVLAPAEHRLQLLSADDRPVLTAAAVLGPEFSFALLEGVTNLDEEVLLDSIDRLLATHLIDELPLKAGEDCYRFAQESLRQALLNTVSQRRLRTLHQRTGETFEALYGTNQTRYWPALAYHWQKAEVTPKAIDYLHKAGKQARRSYANREAIVFFNKALTLLKTLPDTLERTQQELTLQIALGSVLWTTRLADPEVEKVYARAIELSRQVGETPQLFPALWGLQQIYMVRGEHQQARELGEQCLHLAQSARNPDLLLQAHHALWSILFHYDGLAPALEHAEQGMALYDLQKHRSHAFFYGGHDPGVCCRLIAARALWLLGYPDQALNKIQEAVPISQELSHPMTLVHALNGTAQIHQFRRERQAVQRQAETTLAAATQYDIPFYRSQGTTFQGWALIEQGQVEEGITQMRQGIATQHPGLEIGRSYQLALLAEGHRQAGQVEEGLTVLCEALAVVEKTEERFWEAELYRLRGELLLMQAGANSEDEAEKHFRKAIEVTRQQHAKSLELRAIMSLSRLWRKQDRQAEAYQLLADIYAWFTEGFDTADLKEAKALLEALS
jgi:predicted ATPase